MICNENLFILGKMTEIMLCFHTTSVKGHLIIIRNLGLYPSSNTKYFCNLLSKSFNASEAQLSSSIKWNKSNFIRGFSDANAYINC